MSRGNESAMATSWLSPEFEGTRFPQPWLYHVPRRVPRLILLLLACLVAARTSDAQTLRIVNATVVDVATGELHPASTIVVQGNRITSVSAATADSGGQVVDGTGTYVIPGLWDMHTHAFFGERTPESRDLILPLFIANGVTGIRYGQRARARAAGARRRRGTPAARSADDRLGTDA